MPDYTHSVDFSMLSCSPLPPTGCKYRGIPESSPHRYPTHILSHNHYHRMCICEETEGQKSKKSTFIPTQSTFRCFHALYFGPTVSNMETFWTHVHAGTSHTFCLTTTTFPCVFVKKYEVKSRKKGTFIHTKSTFRCFHVLNLRQPAANIEIRWTEVHTDTPHGICLTTTTFQCVFVKKWEVTRRKNA